MLQATTIIIAIDTFIASTEHKLTIEELQPLIDIRSQLNNAKSEEEILKWIMELIKFMTLIKEFIL